MIDRLNIRLGISYSSYIIPTNSMNNINSVVALFAQQPSHATEILGRNQTTRWMPSTPDQQPMYTSGQRVRINNPNPVHPTTPVSPSETPSFPSGKTTGRKTTFRFLVFLKVHVLVFDDPGQALEKISNLRVGTSRAVSLD